MQGASERRAEEVKQLLAEIDEFEPAQIEPDLRQNLAKIRRLLAKKEEEVTAAKAEVANLRVRVAKQQKRLGKLEKETETYRAQTLFLQSVSSLDSKQLVAYHHEIVQNSNIIDNYLGKAIKNLRAGAKVDEALRNLEKLSLANKRVTAIAQFATKANFRSTTGKEPTDIPAFVEQYIVNVARDFIGSGLRLEVDNLVKEPFEVKARRIELSIVIDNIVSNASKAQAGTLKTTLSKTGQNILLISFRDDGRGLSEAIKNITDIFDPGVTTTSGSGLGLYHAREIIKDLGGQIIAIPAAPKGLEIRVELTR